MAPKEIRKIRDAYGVTQLQLARALNVSAQTVHFWEHGTYAPTDFHLTVLYRLGEMASDSALKSRAVDALSRAGDLPSVPAGSPFDRGASPSVAFAIGFLLDALYSSSSPKRR